MSRVLRRLRPYAERTPAVAKVYRMVRDAVAELRDGTAGHNFVFEG